VKPPQDDEDDSPEAVGSESPERGKRRAGGKRRSPAAPGGLQTGGARPVEDRYCPPYGPAASESVSSLSSGEVIDPLLSLPPPFRNGSSRSGKEKERTFPFLSPFLFPSSFLSFSPSSSLSFFFLPFISVSFLLSLLVMVLRVTPLAAVALVAFVLGFAANLRGALGDAVLIAHKTIHEADLDPKIQTVVAGRPTRVRVSLFNVGDTAALSVHVDDSQAWKTNVPAGAQDSEMYTFAVTGGQKGAQTSWSQIAPGENVTHEYEVVAGAGFIGNYMPRNSAQVRVVDLQFLCTYFWCGENAVVAVEHFAHPIPFFPHLSSSLFPFGVVCVDVRFLHLQVFFAGADASDPDTTSLLWSTQLSWHQIESAHNYDHRNGSHVIEWTFLLALIGCVCGIPYYYHNEAVSEKKKLM
jgi:Translocon-associated protein beta (TRAPB)